MNFKKITNDIRNSPSFGMHGLDHLESKILIISGFISLYVTFFEAIKLILPSVAFCAPALVDISE